MKTSVATVLLVAASLVAGMCQSADNGTAMGGDEGTGGRGRPDTDIRTTGRDPASERTTQSVGWTLTRPQLDLLASGGVVAEGDVAPDRAAADVRAAVQIEASREQVFRTLTDCSLALRFVPHLKRCVVLAAAPDGSWQDVEQRVDYGWLMPSAGYVFHAEYVRYERIEFATLRGDFKENRGEWEFQSLNDGRTTLVTYRARLEPDFYVPRWMMRSILKRDLPALMRGLRTHAEALPPQGGAAAAPPSGTGRAP